MSSEQSSRYTDPRPGSMKVLGVVALFCGLRLLSMPFGLIGLMRATTQGEPHPSQDQMLYTGLMTMCSAVVGLQLCAGAMFAFQLREWARKLLLVGSSLLIILKLTDVITGIRVTGTVSLGSWLPQLLWIVPAGMTIYVYSTYEVRQLFKIAGDVRRRAKEGGDVRTASQG